MTDTIGGAVVIVSDQQKAIEFYTQKLGFELKSDIPFGVDKSSTERVYDGLRLHQSNPSQLLVLWYQIL